VRTLSGFLNVPAFYSTTLSMLAACGLMFGQQPSTQPPADATRQQTQAPAHGWRRVTEPPPNQPARSDPADSRVADSRPPDESQSQGSDTPDSGAGSRLTVKRGTFVTVRVDQALSTDWNREGDAFSATLARPLVIDGVIVAQRGQTVGGRISEAQKAGRVQGVSRLGLQLTDLTLVDGQQVPVQSQLISRSGSTSMGRDAGAIAGTTALGAAIGGAADWGRGAAIGAGAGAALGAIGVLLTRGRPSVIYPESLLTFRIEAPVTISTERAPQAFRNVEPTDYDRSSDTQAPTLRSRACEGYGCPPPPPPYYYSYYGPAYYPYFWGPRYYWGSGYYFGRGFYGHRYYRGFRR